MYVGRCDGAGLVRPHKPTACYKTLCLICVCPLGLAVTSAVTRIYACAVFSMGNYVYTYTSRTGVRNRNRKVQRSQT